MPVTTSQTQLRLSFQIHLEADLQMTRTLSAAAIAVWTQTGDVDHAWIIGSYFHFSVPNGWSAPQAKDISPAGGIFSRGDPMYVAYAHKKT